MKTECLQVSFKRNLKKTAINKPIKEQIIFHAIINNKKVK